MRSWATAGAGPAYCAYTRVSATTMLSFHIDASGAFSVAAARSTTSVTVINGGRRYSGVGVGAKGRATGGRDRPDPSVLAFGDIANMATLLLSWLISLQSPGRSPAGLPVVDSRPPRPRAGADAVNEAIGLHR